MKISRILGFIGIASVMTNQATTWQKDLHSSDLRVNWHGRSFPCLDYEDFDEVLSNTWHWLGEFDIEVEEKPIVRNDWEKVNRLDYFKVKDIPQWTSELKNIQNQYEAKVVEMAKPTSYWFWNK